MTQRLTFYGFLKLVRPVLAASVLGLIAFVRLATAHPFIIDQSFEPPVATGSFNSILANEPIGQEFTPTLPTLDVVELFLEGLPSVPGANVVVLVRQGTITGPILGTSAVVSLPAVPPGNEELNGVFHFDFASSVALIPGDLYVIELDHLSGGNWAVMSGVNGYPGGRLIAFGLPSPNEDLWFREGPAAEVPEPSAMFFVAATLLGWVGVSVLRTIL
jgi:hypothetical protein